MNEEMTKEEILEKFGSLSCDDMAKQILANKEILAWLMKECLAEYKRLFREGYRRAVY